MQAANGVIAVAVIWGLFVTYCKSQCPVHPLCSCKPSNHTNIACGRFSKTVPQFLSSPVYFRRLTLSNELTTSIEEGAFLNLSITELAITYVQISNYGCEDFVGLEQTLIQLRIAATSLSSVPKCAIGKLTLLTELELYSNEITRIQTGDFENLQSLTSLRLDGNTITVVESGSFKGLDKLASLNLQLNNIAQFSDMSLQGLGFLKYLYLQNNNIASLPLRIFDTTKKLESLYLDSNNLIALPNHIFDRTINLKTLYANNNRLASLPPTIFSKTTLLSSLHLNGNNLRSIPRYLFNSTTNIRFIFFSDNQLTTFNFDAVSGLRNLQYLYLNSTQTINSSKYESFFSDLSRNSPSVTALNLRNVGIKSLPPGAFSDLKVLETLDLSQNKIEEIPERFLANSPKIKYLFFQNNHISEIPLAMFKVLGPELFHLDLSGNQLSYTTGKALVEQLPTLTGLRQLLLSDTPLPSLSDNITEQLSLMTVLYLRNCSLDDTTDISKMMSSKETDFSMNRLKTLGTTSEPVSIAIPVMTLNISHNFLVEMNILFAKLRYVSMELYADNNQLEKVTFSGNVSRPYVSFKHLSLSHNSVSHSLNVSSLRTCEILDLSHNSFSNVTEFPLVDPSISTPCPTFGVITLNFSHNVITTISPNACLGRVTTVDLSYNQLTALPWLIPSSRTLALTVKNLFLIGNKLFSLSPDKLGGPGTSIRIIDVRLNQFRDIDNLEEMIRSSALERLYLSGNPLSCRCSSSWMRDDKVSKKFDTARCQTPPEAKLYLLQCYSIEFCPQATTSLLSPTTETHTFCDEDVALEIRNLIWSTEGEKVVIGWTTAGPGGIRGLKLIYRDPQDPKVDGKILIHPDQRSVVLDELVDGHTYNVCLIVENTPEFFSDPSCLVVTTNVPNGQLVVIALASTLSVCAAALFALLFCLCIRRCFKSRPKQTSPSSLADVAYSASYVHPIYEHEAHEYDYVNHGWNE